MIEGYTRWAELDPATHPFELAGVRAPIEAMVLAASTAGGAAAEVISGADRILLTTCGAWAGAWRWAATEPGGGGPVQGWCCERDSIFRDDDAGPLDTAERILGALASWRSYLEELAALFAELVAETAGFDLARIVERAAGRLVPLVVERTDATDAWYQTYQRALIWFIDAAHLVPDDAFETREVAALVDEAIAGQFQSWATPDEGAIAEVTARARAAAPRLAAPPRTPSFDALATWLATRAEHFAPEPRTPPRAPVAADGHERYIATFDRARDPERADRLASALVLCRDSAHRGLALTFDQLAEWQAVVLGRSQPVPFRTTDAFAKRGRERYPIAPDTPTRFDALLAETAASTDPIGIRAARLYFDVCFFHPFDDGNARAARLALDHLLTSAGLALHTAEPLFVVSRAADDRRLPRMFASLVDLLAGPPRAS